jgi:hypothetical protein
VFDQAGFLRTCWHCTRTDPQQSSLLKQSEIEKKKNAPKTTVAGIFSFSLAVAPNFRQSALLFTLPPTDFIDHQHHQ